MSKRKAILAVVGSVCLVSLVYGVDQAWLRPQRQHARAFAQVRAAMYSVAERRPDGVTGERWIHTVDWTNNAISNCCATLSYFKDKDEALERFVVFANELSRRSKDDITLNLIDWIWDQLEIISKYGTYYTSQYRPMISKDVFRHGS